MSPPLSSFASPILAAWSDTLSSTFANSIAAVFERGTTIPLVAIIGGLFVGATVAVSALYFTYRKQQMWHDTARIARLFGLNYTKEGGTINHDFRTAIVDVTGDVQSVWPIGGDTTDMIVSELLKAATNAVKAPGPRAP